MAWFDEYVRQAAIEEARRKKQERDVAKATDAPILEVLENNEHPNIIENVTTSDTGKIRTVELIDTRPAAPGDIAAQISRGYLRVQSASNQEWLINGVWGVREFQMPKKRRIQSAELVEILQLFFDDILVD